VEAWLRVAGRAPGCRGFGGLVKAVGHQWRWDPSWPRVRTRARACVGCFSVPSEVVRTVVIWFDPVPVRRGLSVGGVVEWRESRDLE